ncbi:ABC transporter permease [Aeromicrobium sp.]|uniref:ABC transporter permease n=1 Tax=Aeromicrobium sp. TaxID=1871063 RepID=UPI0030C10B5B
MTIDEEALPPSTYELRDGRITAGVRTVAKAPVRGLDAAGDQVHFYLAAFAGIPYALTRHRREIVRLIAGVTFGTGALAVIGGTVVTVAFLTAFTGIEVGLQGYSQLSDIGVEALSGFISAYINTRLVAPVIAGIALVATVGAGFTAQLGAMRVAEEIDALEVMSVRSIPFLVSTRIIAGSVAIIPIFAGALLSSWVFTRLIVTVGFGQSTGAYDHYFSTFLIPTDIIISFVKVLGMALVIMTIHCYYGFTASGGPAGVGQAVGRAVRLSLVVILFTDLLLSFALYGSTDTLNISG